VLAALAGCFHEAGVATKVQFGAAWWFQDHRDGMEAQLRDLANVGLLSPFVGMLTDSRSFLSYPRHEYFRRILCNLVGRWVEDGECPDIDAILEPLIRGICCDNARTFFRF
jgi:glucuronate isomerase